MSINVTVNGNPISIRRGKMILSDLENIKKTEREHRKRLRLEQVQEQSRALSKKLLERVRQVKHDELSRLEHDANSEIRRAHDRRLMEFHRRYQDIEHIGYAHENAAKQPDIESIKQAEEQRNRSLAKARGMEATQRFQESKKVVSPYSKQQERLRKVRDMENQRSCMISQLPKKLCIANNEPVESSENESISNVVPTISSSSKKKKKVIVTRKSPIKKPPKQIKTHATQTKTPSRVSVCVNSEDKSKTSTTSSMVKSNTSNSNILANTCKTVSDIMQDVNRIDICESDDNEPRRKVPETCTKSSQPEKLIKYNTENYQESNSSDISSTLTTLSSSTSDDSSYFSDSNTKVSTVKKAPKRRSSPISSKTDMYDHKTRQKLTYNTPSGIVERLNLKNKPNADELAQEMIEQETRESAALASQREILRQRSQDAMLREKVKRDFEAFLKNLDQLAKEERKLKASQVSENANQEQVSVPTKKSVDSVKRQKKMDRAFQNILRSSRDPTSYNNQVERPITITPHDYIHSERSPVPSWKEPPYIDNQETEVSCSEDDDQIVRRIKISEHLLKIEKLKKKLLQEYGATLPDDIFNASVKSLFNQSSASANCEKITPPKPTSPEIQVINMSSCDEAAKSKRFTASSNKKTNNKVPVKMITPKSTASNVVSTRDQQVQVELKQNKSLEEVIKHPIEPIIEVVTPENANSSSTISCNSSCSNSSTATDVVIDVSKKGVTVVRKDRCNTRVSKDGSTISSAKSAKCSVAKTPVKISFEQKGGSGSFEVAGLLIDPDKKEITVLPKKKKSSETVSRKVSPMTCAKSVSLPGSRINSPSKKQSKSAPPSRHSSPKKSYMQSRHARSLELEENNFENPRYKTSVYTQVSIDSSTESSQLNSTSDGNSKFYTRFKTLAAQRIITRLQDTSDTSTTYASPPAPTAGAMINALNSTTPILELLDSSTNERIRRNVKKVSPVSSPETPSPRTMKLPSNIPRSNKANKSLKFTSIINTQSKSGPTNISKSVRTTPLTAKDKPTSSKSIIQSQACSCKNPNCKLVHDRLENLQSYAKHCPEIMKKYDHLQNVCAERIASLTDLIEKVRNEQKGLELSVVTNEDSNSTSQVIPRSQSSTSVDASKLAKEMEAVYTQLKKTLAESQKIISGEGIEIPKPMMPYKNIEKSPTYSIDLSKDTTASESLDENAEKAKTAKATTPVAPTKPRVLNSERVNLRLGRFRLGSHGSRKSSVNDESKAGAATTRGPSDVNDDMVKMLSNEILEQSKSLNKSVSVDHLKDSDDSLLKSSQALVKNSEDSSKNIASNDDNEQSVNLESSNSDFVPLLAGIPKIPRALSKGSTTNGRGRPPVTLISGPYRPEILSPVHELSTIVEFDTPDTINKSQISTRSPSNKCRKKLPSSEDLRSTLLAPVQKTDVKLGKCKPSVHVAPLPAHRSPQSSHNFSNKSATKATDKSPKKSVDKSFESLEKKKDFKSQSLDSMHTLPDIHIEELQQSQDNTDANYDFRISQISELHSLPDENIDNLLISEIHEENKSKFITPSRKNSQNTELDEDKGRLTSTSSRSISGLSGVSEITTTPSSDLSLFKYPSSPEEMDLALKKLGLAWAIPTLKKTREASALGSSSSSDVTPINTATRLAPLTKKHQDGNSRNLLEISDVSSISIKHANKSTERSVLVKGRTSTPNRLSNTNSDGTVSTLGSFSSEMNIVVQNSSADITVPNISFSNNKFG